MKPTAQKLTLAVAAALLTAACGTQTGTHIATGTTPTSTSSSVNIDTFCDSVATAIAEYGADNLPAAEQNRLRDLTPDRYANLIEGWQTGLSLADAERTYDMLASDCHHAIFKLAAQAIKAAKPLAAAAEWQQSQSLADYATPSDKICDRACEIRRQAAEAAAELDADTANNAAENIRSAIAQAGSTASSVMAER